MLNTVIIGDAHINARSFEEARFTSLTCKAKKHVPIGLLYITIHLETLIKDPITEMGVGHTYLWAKDGKARTPRAPPVPPSLKLIMGFLSFLLAQISPHNYRTAW